MDANADKPALLVISGPGGRLSAVPQLFAPWEQSFAVRHWDQPFANSIEELVTEGLAVAAALGERRLILLGISGGTIVGLHMVKRRPDLFAGYVGCGQVVNWARQDALSYELILQATNDEELRRVGPPPYSNIADEMLKARFAVAPTPAEQEGFYLLMQAGAPSASKAFEAYIALRYDIQTFDAERLGLDFQVPMFFLQGERDLYTVTSEVQDYAAKIQAPTKAFLTIAGGGHSPWLITQSFREALTICWGKARAFNASK
jgi:pimeloyl-ACP methyl ester carboxylesterase